MLRMKSQGLYLYKVLGGAQPNFWRSATCRLKC